MKEKSTRLYFIDAIRAWAILMMLQGHFIDGLLNPVFRDSTLSLYNLWKYFRGMTAPVFFTVSGFIFTYLLIRSPKHGFSNPRVKKGLKRGIELLVIGYLLRMNLLGIIHGEIYSSFYLVDVLHCIGLSIIGILVIYLLFYRGWKTLFSGILFSICVGLFLFEPIYRHWTFEFLPTAIANYVTKANGSVFTIIPWFGYTAMGAFISVLFTKFKDHTHLYSRAILISTLIGLLLIFCSSDIFMTIHTFTGITLFSDIFYNNYLFIRLGDVCIVFAVCMLIRKWLTNSTLLKIGQSTLSIYIIHFIILYGSFTGLGLYQYYHHSLNAQEVIIGAVFFIIVCAFTALVYERYKAPIKSSIAQAIQWLYRKVRLVAHKLFGLVKN